MIRFLLVLLACSPLNAQTLIRVAPVGPAVPGAEGVPNPEDGSVDAASVSALPLDDALWPGLERTLLSAAGASDELKTEVWIAETSRRLKADPGLPLPRALADALTAVHRLPPASVEAVRDAVGRDGGKIVPQETPQRLLMLDGLAHGVALEKLRLLKADGGADVASLPSETVRVVERFDGRLYAGAVDGVFVQEGTGWRKLAPFTTHSLGWTDGTLYAGTERGLFRLAGTSWVREKALKKHSVYKLAEHGGSWFASTDKGVFEGAPVQRTVVRRVLPAGPEPATPWGKIASLWRHWTAPKQPFQVGGVDWSAEPVFQRTEIRKETHGYSGSREVEYSLHAFDTAEIGGKLHVATEAGLFVRHPDGAWKEAVRGKRIQKILQLPSGPLAFGSEGVWMPGKRGWKRTLKFIKEVQDAAAVDDALFVLGEELRLLVLLPEKWHDRLLGAVAALASAEDEAAKAPAPEPETRLEEGSIVGRAGRTLFSSSMARMDEPIEPKFAPKAAEAPWPELEQAALRALGAKDASKSVEFRDEAIRRLRREPDAPLQDSLAGALAAVHRLDSAHAETARLAFGGHPLREPRPIAVKRFITAGGKLFGAMSDNLLELDEPHGFKEVSPLVEIHDMIVFGGKTYAGNMKGVSRLEGGIARAMPIDGSPSSPYVRSFVEVQGRLFAAAEKGIYRLDEDGVFRPTELPPGEPFNIAQLAGRIYASTSRGVFEGKLVVKDEKRQIKERVRKPADDLPWWLRWLPKPKPVYMVRTITVKAPVIEWDSTPVFQREFDREVVDDYYGGKKKVRAMVRAHQTIEDGGRLWIAAEDGIYSSHRDGFKNELEGVSVHRLRRLPSGFFAAAEDGLYRADPKGWTKISPKRTYDVFELDGLLLVASDELSLHAVLPVGWSDQVLASVMRSSSAPPPAQSDDPLRSEGQKIVGRGGRSVFNPDK
jgi:hypothetical protein